MGTGQEVAWLLCHGQRAPHSHAVLPLVLLCHQSCRVSASGCAVDMQVVASDPSVFPQGSIQQLTIHPDPRTPEELCEAEESSVSPHLPYPHSWPRSPAAGLPGRAGCPGNSSSPTSWGLYNLSSWPVLPQVLFWAFWLCFIIFKSLVVGGRE